MTITLNNDLLQFLNEHDTSVGMHSIEKLDSEVISEIEESFNLKTIDYKENYFIFLDDENIYNVYHLNQFTNKWNERTFIQKEYDLLQLQNKEIEEIYYNGITTKRLNFYMDDGQFKIVVDFMKENNMYTLDTESNTPQFRIYTGNNCIPHVPVKFIPIIEKFLGHDLNVDMEYKRIGNKVIDTLNINNKVLLTMYGVFGNTEIKGTVIRKEKDSVHIRPYRSKNKYYNIKTLSLCDIKVISSFK